MADPHRDAFLRLVVDPAKLPREAQIECLRGAAGKLQAFDDLELRWLGRVLGERMRAGGDLEVMFALRPTRGSRATAEALGRSAEIRRLLVQLAHAVGVPRGSRILRGIEETPTACADLVAALRTLHAPCSESAFDRARKASRDRR